MTSTEADNMVNRATILGATGFEHRHPMLIHLLIVGAAWSTYIIEKDDVVWRFIKDYGAATRPLEHLSFLAATFLIGIGAYICTKADFRLISWQTTTQSRDEVRDSSSPWWKKLPLLHHFGEAVYALGFASLMPLTGFIILILGEFIRLGRLSLSHQVSPKNSRCLLVARGANWAAAIRLESLKWGIFVSMAVFTITLIDRLADVLIAASFLLWMFIQWHIRDAARSQNQ